MTTKMFRLLVAADGSPAAEAALEAACRFPWPQPVDATVVVARGGGLALPAASPDGTTWAHQVATAVGEAARARLATVWDEPGLIIEDGEPDEVILEVARRRRVQAIAMGWRGHGRFRRLLMGSVSRQVLRDARVPVLVAREKPTRLRRFVVGLDDSDAAAHAVQLLARLTVPAGGLVTLMTAVSPVRIMRAGAMSPGIVARVKAEVATHNARARDEARARLDRAADRLARAGWRARPVLTAGDPLVALIQAATAVRADVLVVGAGSVGALARGRLGAVTEGAVSRSTIPVLVTR